MRRAPLLLPLLLLSACANVLDSRNKGDEIHAADWYLIGTGMYIADTKLDDGTRCVALMTGGGGQMGGITCNWNKP